MARLYRRRRRIKPPPPRKKIEPKPDERKREGEGAAPEHAKYDPKKCESNRILDMLPPPSQVERPKDRGEAERQARLESEYFKRGNTLFNKGLYDEAIKKFNAVLKMAPDDPDVNFNAGLCYQFLGKPRSALKVLLESLRSRPRWGEAWFVISGIMLKLEMFDEAEEACCYAIKDGCKQEEQAYERLGRVLWAQKRFKHASDVFKDCLEEWPDNAIAHYFLGQLQYRKARLDRAKELLEKATRLSPKFAEAWNALGRVQCLMGLIFEALPSFEHALNANPQNKVALRWKSFLAKVNKTFKLTLPTVIPEYKVPQTATHAYVQVGLKLIEAESYEFAVTVLELAIQQIPDNAAIEVWYGVACALTNQYDIAMDTWQKLHDDTPEDKRLRLLLAFGYTITCRRKLALQMGESFGGKVGEVITGIANTTPVIFDQPWTSTEDDIEELGNEEEDEEESSVVAYD